MLAVWPYRGYIGTREAVLRVRSHISPGPYRSFRELSLAGPVGSDIWCPPTFVGNSGIERFNGICGFALNFWPFACWPFAPWTQYLPRLNCVPPLSRPAMLRG